MGKNTGYRYRPDFSKHAELREKIEQLAALETKELAAILQGEMQPEDKVLADIQVRRYKSQAEDLKRKYNAIIKSYEHLEGKHNDALDILAEPKRIAILPTLSEKREATAVLQASDWHVEEVVNPSTVQGLNKYNPEIAKKRAHKFFQESLKAINHERSIHNVDNLVLHLGGDFIGGWIHPELMQTNAMSPIEASEYATELLYSGLGFLRDFGKFKTITAVCNRGNHGRNSVKMQFANEAATNYETFIYSALKKHVEGVDFLVPDSDIAYLQIYDWMHRFFHGQQVKYNGGVGGITPSLNKKESAWDKTVYAHYNHMGHFHTYSHPNKRTTLNGSLKGFDAFAASLGFDYEPPTQALTIIDRDRGATTRKPIYCE